MLHSKISYTLMLLGLFLAIQPAQAQQRPQPDSLLMQKVQEYRDLEDFDAKVAMVEQLAKEFPGENNVGIFDYLNGDLAITALDNLNMEEYEKYKGEVSDPRMVNYRTAATIGEWAEEGNNLELAAKLGESMIKQVAEQKESGEGYDVHVHSAVMENNAYLQHALGNGDKSLEYLAQASELMSRKSPQFIAKYAAIQMDNNKYQEAYKMLSDKVVSGDYTEEVVNELKKAYKEVEGDSGFDAYLTSLEQAAYKEALAEMAKKQNKDPQPAPKFTLEDMEGNAVSLEDYKGKIVVVDFWATWCGPCKMSFPGMQQAVNEYADDPHVEFLFIDTWQNEDNYKELVENFISENGYTFNVLYDSDDKVVEEFGVRGIPTKFIIDGEGNIQFKSVGFDGSDAAVLNSMKAMIELVKGNGATASK